MKKLSAVMAVLLTVIMATALLFAGCSSSSDGGDSPNPTPTSGAGKILGTVTDEGGTPLKGATVNLTTANKGNGEKSNTTTDENGNFIFENLATGVKYYVTVSYQGKVTVLVFVEVTDENMAPAFKLYLPQGSGSVSFNLPEGAVMKTPVLTGRKVELEWNMSRNANVEFEANYLYRKASSEVTTNDTLLATFNSVVELKYTDNVTEDGRWHYRIFTGYKVEDSNVKILLGSNEVQSYVDKYVFNKRWDDKNIPIQTPSPSPSVTGTPYAKATEAYYTTAPYVCASYEKDGDTTVYFSDVYQGYIFKIVNDGEVVPFYPPTYPYETLTSKSKEVVEPGLMFATGMSVDKDGNLYVMDQNRAIIYVFSPSGELLAESPCFEELMRDITVYDDGSGTKTIYACSGFNFNYAEVYKLTFDGTTFTEPTLYKLYEYKETSTSMELPFILGVKVDSQGNVFIADTFVKFEDFKNGKAQIENKISGKDISPWSDATFEAHVKKFTAGGALLYTLTGSGIEGDDFVYPAGIAVDEYDCLYVGDTNNSPGFYLYNSDAKARVLKFDGQGNYMTQFGSYGAPIQEFYGAGSKETNNGEFTTPRGITVLKDKSAYVTDPYGASMQKFILDEETDE